MADLGVERADAQRRAEEAALGGPLEAAPVRFGGVDEQQGGQAGAQPRTGRRPSLVQPLQAVDDQQAAAGRRKHQDALGHDETDAEQHVGRRQEGHHHQAQGQRQVPASTDRIATIKRVPKRKKTLVGTDLRCRTEGLARAW